MDLKLSQDSNSTAVLPPNIKITANMNDECFNLKCEEVLMDLKTSIKDLEDLTNELSNLLGYIENKLKDSAKNLQETQEQSKHWVFEFKNLQTIIAENKQKTIKLLELFE